MDEVDNKVTNVVPGVVTAITKTYTDGLMVTITHKNGGVGATSRFPHMGSVTVVVGEEVSGDALIGYTKAKFSNHMYVVYSIDADSWQGGMKAETFHNSLESAIAAIPEGALKYERTGLETMGMVKYYVYYAIRIVNVQG